jgi:hypothetical protein
MKKSAQPSTAPHIEALLETVSGHDVDHAVQVAAHIMKAGAWRSWMVKWFIRRHRGQASRLMRRLGPMIPR